MRGARGLLVASALAAAFLLLLPELHVVDVPIALAIAMLALMMLPRTGWRNAAVRVRPLEVARALAGLTWQTVRQSVVGTWRITTMTLGLTERPVPGLVDVELGGRSPQAAVVGGLLLALSPGTLLVRVDEDAGSVTFHLAGMERRSFEQDAERVYGYLRTLMS